MRRRRRPVDLPGGVRHGRGRGGRRRAAAVVAEHSGLAEIAVGVASEYPPELSYLPAFPNGDADALRERLRELFALAPEERRALGAAARRAVERKWSWSRVADRLLEPLSD